MTQIILFLAFILLAIYLLAFRSRKKVRKIKGFDENWRKILNNKVKYYQQLNEVDKTRFEQEIVHFLETVIITGTGVEINDEDRILVASSAVIPIFAFPNWQYKNLNEVLLYPNSFSEEYKMEGEDRNVAGMVGWGPMNRTMILSRQSLHQGFENETSKSNVGIHEFVHLIDKSDGATDGIPELLLERQYTLPWIKMIHNSIKEIKENKSGINPYGATNDAEFLSVAAEYFFKRPELMQQKEPELFEMLELVFNQNPLDMKH